MEPKIEYYETHSIARGMPKFNLESLGGGVFDKFSGINRAPRPVNSIDSSDMFLFGHNS